MDNFIILIIIIVAINLINSLLRAFKKGSTDRRESSTLRVREPFLEQPASQRITDPYRSSAARPDKSIEYSSEDSSSKKHPVEVESDQPDDDKCIGQVAAISNHQSPLAANLQHMLTRKDPLVTAFVFHEILEPPLAVRKRYKK